MIALPLWLLLGMCSSLGTGADAVRNLHGFDAWVTTPACPQLPLETESKDSFGRLWGWDNSAKRSCAFKFNNQQPILLNLDNQQQTWEAASACLEAPTGNNSAPDWTWRLWGVYYGRQCAFKDVLGQPIYYADYAGARYVPPTEASTAPSAVPALSPAAQPASPLSLSSTNSATQKTAASSSQQQITAKPPAGTTTPASSPSPATSQLPSSSKNATPAAKPMSSVPATKPTVLPVPMPSPVVWVDVDLAKLQPQSATTPSCTCDPSLRVDVTALAEAVVDVLLRKLPRPVMGSLDVDVKAAEKAAIISRSSSFQASEKQQSNVQGIDKPSLAHFLSAAGTSESSSGDRGTNASTQQILANLLSAVTTARQDQQSTPINTPVTRPEDGEPPFVQGRAGTVNGIVASTADEVYPTRPSDCLQNSCSLRTIVQKQQVPTASPEVVPDELQQATTPATVP